MQITRTKIQLPAIVFIVLGVFLYLLSSGGVATAGYADSRHGNTSTGVNRSGAECPPGTPCPRGDCGHCHDTFDPLICGVNEIMLFADNEEGLCETCHNGIGDELDKTYHHPTHDYSGRHTQSSGEWGQGGAPFRGANRHAECADCHNPHTAGGIETNTPRIHPVQLSSPQRDSNGNSIYDASLGTDALQGVWGVEPSGTYGIVEGSPDSFIETLPANGYPRYAEKEYQICFKCHSDYAYQGTGTFPDDLHAAREFSPLNKSGHPVMVTQSNRTGSDSPKELKAYQVRWYGNPWNAGQSTMYCSDCHGSQVQTGPQGVHGQDDLGYAGVSPAMLRSWQGNNRIFWPNDPDGNYWHLERLEMYPEGYHQTTDPWDWKLYLFCINCHTIYDKSREGLPPDYGWANHAHRYHRNWSGRCTYCHVQRVHGSQMDRLIGGEHDGYRVLQFRKQSNSLTGYSQTDCYNEDAGGTFRCRHPAYHNTPIE